MQHRNAPMGTIDTIKEKPNDNQQSYHAIILNTLKNLGYKYDPEGMCRGIVCWAMHDLLTIKNPSTGLNDFINKLQLFNNQELVQSILEKMKQQIKLENKVAANEINEDYELRFTYKELSLLALCDTITLYHDTEYYPQLFPKDELLGQNTQTSMSILKKKKELNQLIIPHIYGAYTENTLRQYLTTLTDVFANTPCNIILTSSNHVISLHYCGASKQWLLIDSNQLPFKLIELDNIYNEIQRAFVLKNNIAIFNSEIFTCAEQNEKLRIHNALEKHKNWKAIHHIENATVNLQDSYGATLLWNACQHGHITMVELLLKNGAAINQPKNNGSTPLTIACQNGHIAVVELLLNRNAAINQPQNNGTTPLTTACQHGHIAVVELLLKRNAAINQPNNTGCTPLWIACHAGHVAVVKTLLQNGAATVINDVGIDKTTPLWMACKQGHIEVVELLLKRNAAINQPKNNNCTPLWIACHAGHSAVVTLLLNNGAATAINDAGTQKTTPLWVACLNGHIAVVELLLNSNAEINQASNDGSTPLWVACQNGHLDVVKKLLAHKVKVDVDALSISNFTPLHATCLSSHKHHTKEIIKLLIQHNASLYQKNALEQTALDIAIAQKNPNALEVLVSHILAINTDPHKIEVDKIFKPYLNKSDIKDLLNFDVVSQLIKSVQNQRQCKRKHEQNNQIEFKKTVKPFNIFNQKGLRNNDNHNEPTMNELKPNPNQQPKN